MAAKVWTSGETLTAAQQNVVAAQADVALKPSGNLAGLASAATARTNLGLAGVAATGDYDDLDNRPITEAAHSDSWRVVDEYGGIILRASSAGLIGAAPFENLTTVGTIDGEAITIAADASASALDFADEYGFVGMRLNAAGAAVLPGATLARDGAAFGPGTFTDLGADTATIADEADMPGAVLTTNESAPALDVVDEYGFVTARINADGSGTGAFGGTSTTTPVGITVDPALVIRRGAEGDVWGATYPTPHYAYNSTQGDKSQAFTTRGDIDSPIQGQVANTGDLFEVWISGGQSWRNDSPPLTDLAVEASTIEDRNAAFRFATSSGALRGHVGSSNGTSGIYDLKGIGLSDWGDQIGTAALLALQRMRRAAGMAATPGMTYGATYPAYSWSQLGPGEFPWTALLSMNASAASIIPQYGKTARWKAVGWTHSAGGDDLAGMKAAYDALDLNAGQAALHYFTDQTPATTTETGGSTLQEKQNEQLQFCLDDPDYVHMIGPRYPYPFIDYIHHTGPGYVAIGELEALAKHVVLDRGLDWLPLYMTAVYIDGSTLTIDVSQPIEGEIHALSIDTTTIEAASQYGLRLKVNGSYVTLSAIAVDRHRITATIAAPPTSSDTVEVSYAVYGPGSTIGTHAGVWGNIKMVLADSVLLPGESIATWLANQSIDLVSADFDTPPDMPEITEITLSATTASDGGIGLTKVGDLGSSTTGTVGAVTYELTDDAAGKFFIAEGRPYALDPPLALWGIANLPAGSFDVEITARADGAADFVDTFTIVVS